MQQATHQRGRVSTKVRYEPVQLTLDVPTGDALFAWSNDPHKRLPVAVVFRSAAGGSPLESLRMAAAYCVSYHEAFSAGDAQGGAYQAFLTLTDPDGWTLAAGGPVTAFVAPAAREYVGPNKSAIPAGVATAAAFRLMREGTEGVEAASAALIAKVAARRNLHFARTPDEVRYLEFIGAEANVGGEKMNHILMKDPPSKAALLEEFLHGTQHKLGMLKSSADTAFAEWHVKDFMVRHCRLLGLGDEDVAILKTLRNRDYQLLKGIS